MSGTGIHIDIITLTVHTPDGKLANNEGAQFQRMPLGLCNRAMVMFIVVMLVEGAAARHRL